MERESADELVVSARMGAAERHASLVMKAGACSATLKVIQSTVAVAPAVLDRSHALGQELSALQSRIKSRWGDLSNAQQRQRDTVNEATRAVKAAESGSDRAVASKARDALQTAEAGLAEATTALTAPDALLDVIAPELDPLMERIRDLYQDAVQDTSLARAGVEVVEVSRDEFQQGLRYHRSHSTWLLGLMLLLALLGGAGVVALFSEFGGWHPGPAEVAGNGTQAWIHLGLILGGRFSVLLGLGWLLVFAGRMHSRHAQQAVTYQERLMGLDAAKMVIHHGTGPVREQLLHQLTTTFLSLDGNAFKPELRGPRSRFSLRELRQVTRALAELRRPPVVAGARRPRPNSSTGDG
jgi:hypothetical protein